MEWADKWLAADKFQHVLACFLITLLISFVASRSRYAFLRRRNAVLGSIASLATGAVKEAGDEIGVWRSSGGSVKDVIADLVGVGIALMLMRWFGSARKEFEGEKGIEMV